MSNKILTLLLFFSISLSGCASSSQQVSDVSTLEKYNRAMFSFNNKVDKYVVRPVAKGYKAVTNKYIRTRVSNFFNNIDEPVSAANHILQGEFGGTGTNLSRFVINTTLGVAGLFDVATSLGVQKDKTSFDETMATWCIPDGPFVVLPVIGPGTPRSVVGFVADGYSSPAYWVAHEGNDDAMSAYYWAVGLKYVNLMAENITFLESLEEGSIDYYEAVKSAYLQNRGRLKKCVKKDDVTETPNFDFDMDEMDYN
ncbi:MAG: VacJ family lipoprotein [Alphaproteobacteria bacterium]|nr:VacJ family lipoprotein [Alphaproteobacteria bacterium]